VHAGPRVIVELVPTIDVVIVAYEGWPLTESCLEHLGRQTVAHNVILVDNGSRDGSGEKVRERYPHVAVSRLEPNQRFAVACNHGVAAGSGDVVVLLNNDVDCRPDFLERLVAPLADEQVGAVAALLVQPGERTIDSFGLTADVTLAAIPRFSGQQVEHARADHPVLTVPAGAGAAYRRAAWEQVGGMDETIAAYQEDFELGLRLLAAGWYQAAAPDAVAVHVGSATFGKRSAFQRRESGFGRAYVLRRYGILRSRAAARALLGEALVVLGDALMSRDLEALRGRMGGWRAAAGQPRREMPPPVAIERDLSFADSMRLRRAVYSGRPALAGPFGARP
jgi:GT2 family glycosyltransferase